MEGDHDPRRELGVGDVSGWVVGRQAGEMWVGEVWEETRAPWNILVWRWDFGGDLTEICKM